MTGTLAHRGPDDVRFFEQPGVGLGFRRLAIVDVESGAQPFFNEDKTIVAVCNGEIYNCRELQKLLEKKGHQFYTRSDVEVLPHLYEEYGEVFVEHLRGMFAFALLDCKKWLLLLGRDRLGMKPLYYTQEKEILYFASELKSLLVVGGKREVSLEALYDYCTFGYVPPGKGIFKAFPQLPPAHILRVSEGGCTARKYWGVSRQSFFQGRKEEAAELLRERLRDAVSAHLLSDVPVGLLLSGGLDSSVVLALASQVSSQPLQVFTVGFDVSSYNELPYAQKAAEHFGVRLHTERVSSKSLESFQRALRVLDEPLADPSVVPTHIIAQCARKQVKVVLSGDGGDELFGGYTWLQKEVLLRFFRNLPLPWSVLRPIFTHAPQGNAVGFLDRLGRFLYDLSAPPLDGYLRRITSFPKGLLSRLLVPEIQRELYGYDPQAPLRAIFQEEDSFFDACLRADREFYLPGDILTKVDRMSMDQSLEVRPPFLDHSLVEFCVQLPFSMKMEGLKSKVLLKRAFQKVLPPEILRQRKHGFAVPIADYFRTFLKDWLKEMLTPVKTPFFNPFFVQELIRAHLAKERDFSYPLWSILAFETWYRQFVLGESL